MLLYQLNSAHFDVKGYFADAKGNKLDNPMVKLLTWMNSSTNWNRLRSLRSQDGSPMQVISVTDGSPSTKQGLTEYNKFCDYDYNTLDWEMRTPKAGSYKKIAWFDPANKWERNYWFGEPVFTENLPGGLRDSYISVKLALMDKDYNDGGWYFGSSSFLDDATTQWNKIFKQNEVKRVEVNAYKGHAFIPTASAAGIRNSDLSAFNQESTWLLPEGTRVLGSNQTMFDAAYLSDRNWVHVSPDDMKEKKNVNPPNHTKIFNLITTGNP